VVSLRTHSAPERAASGRSPRTARLKALLALKPEQRRWKVRLLSDPAAAAVEAPIDRIAPVVNPETQTTLVVGRIANPNGRLRPGQVVRLTITLPQPVNEVAVPASALVEEGGATYVFVQPDARQRVYVPVRVKVVRRGKDTAHVRADEGDGWRLSFREALGGGEAVIDYDGDGWPDVLILADGALRAAGVPHRLRPGDRIVTQGAVELKALLHDLKPAPRR
jgi:multidrug efflux pump subunit AcrA (membrane-fusion protein)